MKIYYQDQSVTILHSSCRDTDLKDITGIVTDPPYELSFMGKKWDGTGISFQPDTWRILRECCKPGAMLLSFGGTRTFHRIAVAIEDAGWEFRDTIMWLYGSGFPKSLDISKAIDKQAGAEREVVGNYHIPNDSTSGHAGKPYSDKPIDGNVYCDPHRDTRMATITSPTTPEAILWSGYGTALKPAFEPILVCMNPLDGTFANNALTHGVAGLNIDGCRVPTNWETDPTKRGWQGKSNWGSPFEQGELKGEKVRPNSHGRFPANIVHDGSEEVLGLFPQTSKAGNKDQSSRFQKTTGGSFSGSYGNQVSAYSDCGSAARFFYCAKASKNERGEYNNHATVKPLALMTYLVKLISPPKDALVLDPFMGSGTTLLACKQLGIKCIGIELDESSCEIAAKRCQSINQEVVN